MSDTVLRDLELDILNNNVRLPRAAALSVFTFDGSGSRREEHTVATSALAVDVDRKNLERIAPGVVEPEAALPQLLSLLAAHGLRPHAIVVSGHGIHLYFRVRRVLLVDDEVRAQVKETWKKLCTLVGDSRDRYDLSSVMRCPGTTNWKDGPPGMPVRLLVEHSEMERPPYELVDIEHAVKDVVLPAKAAQPKKARRVKDARRSSPSEVDAWSEHVLDTMVVLDEKFALARAASRGEVKVKDRSAAAYAFARVLFECGASEDMVADEMRRSAKGLERDELWIDSTVHAAATAGPQPLTTHSEKGFRPFDDVWEAAYSILKSTSTQRGASAPPRLAVVVGRPGSQKTRGATGFFAHALGDELGRVGIMTAFVSEALRIEHAINKLYPFGYEATINDQDVRFEPDLPRKAIQKVDDKFVGGLYGRLPREVRLFRRRDGGMPWSADSLSKCSDLDVGSLFINAYQPRHFDRRLECEEDADGNFTRPFWASSDTDDALFQAHAVAKFRAKAELCFARRTQNDLNRPGACRGCEFKACRSNPEPGAARTYWATAPVALLTHGAYGAHLLFRPDLNDFDALACDEVPDLVYRTPKLQVMASPTFSESARWAIEPLGKLLRLVDDALVVPGPEVVAITTKLRERGELLMKQASKLRGEVMAGRRTPFQYKVADLDPLLTPDEFAVLARHVGRASQADNDPEGTANNVVNDLEVLRDFCADTPVPVLAQQQFRENGDGSMDIVRPVNGFPDLVNGPDGSSRPLVLLDATAGIDPRYMLVGGFKKECLPATEFPNTTVVLTSAKTVTQTKLNSLTPEQVILDVADQLRRRGIQAGKQVLLVTDKDAEPGLRGALDALRLTRPDLLPASVLLDHFGNLRGKNQYIACDAVYFTHVHRKPEEVYLGLELLLAGFKGYPRQWESKNADPWHIRYRSPEVLHASMVCDLYQDLMRINIRRDPSAKATVFLPTSDPRIVTRILRLMRGVTVVLPDARVVQPRTSTLKNAA